MQRFWGLQDVSITVNNSLIPEIIVHAVEYKFHLNNHTKEELNSNRQNGKGSKNLNHLSIFFVIVGVLTEM